MNFTPTQVILIFLLAGYIFTLFILESWIWRFQQKRYLQIWMDFADLTKLQLSPGSFVPRSTVKPLITGKYRNRQISINSETRRRYGFQDAIFRVSVSIKNPKTDELPKGAFFVVGDPRKKGLLSRISGQTGILKSLRPEEVQEFPWKAVPENLGNHLLTSKNAQKILGAAVVNDILIDQGLLRYRQIGLIADPAEMKKLINNLVELADSFERFSKNWIV